MIRRIIIMLAILALIPSNAFAFSLISTSGIASQVDISYKATGNNSTSGDAVLLSFPSSWSVKRVKATSDSGSVADRYASQYGINRIAGFELTCNVTYDVEIYNNQTSTVDGHIKIIVDELVDPSCASGGSGDDEGNGGGNCGCVFNTPGWQEYMGKIDDIIDGIPTPINYNSKLDEIIAAIPPAPDWNSVSQIITGDMRNMLGNAPSLPSQPNAPSGLDDGGLKKPTGQDSGLKGFNDNDIKGGSPIEVNEDPTGGWDILDPLESMPEQEVFIPNEGDLTPPEVPDVEGVAPTPQEPENPVPSNPSEPGGTAPTPSEPGGTAPTPSEPDNHAPTPSEPENTAPTPSEPSNPAPTPGDSENPFPVPGENDWGFPMPGDGSNVAPMPGNDGGQAPIPGQSGLSAPLPKKGVEK